MDKLISDFYVALRNLLRAKRYALNVWLALSLGLSISLAMYVLVWHVLYRGLPVPKVDEIHVLESVRKGNAARDALTGAEAQAFAQQLQAPLQMGSFFWNGSVYTGGELPKPITTLSAQASLLGLLGVQPLYGRLLNDADEGSNNVVLSHSFWSDVLGADPAVIGKPFKESDGSKTVVGILAPEFELLMPRVAYIAHMDLKAMQANAATFQNARFFQGYVRMPKENAAQLNDQLSRIGGEVSVASGYARDEFSFRQSSLFERVVGDVRTPLNALLALSALVLLITLANCAHLTAARSAERSHYYALARALGGTRVQQIRVQWLENIILIAAAIGTVVALLFALSGSINLSASQLPLLQDFSFAGALTGAHVWIALALTAVLAWAAMFVLPWIISARVDNDQLRQKAMRPMGRLHRWLTVPAIAASLIAIASGLLYLQSLSQLNAQRLGLDINTTAVTQTWLRSEKPDEWIAMATQLMNAAAKTPDAQAVAITNRIPFTPTNDYNVDINRTNGATLKTWVNSVAGAYQQALGLQLITGRMLTDADQNSGQAALVNEQFSKLYFKGSDPVGQFVSLPPYGSGEMKTFQIVGVFADARMVSPTQNPLPELLLPFGRYPTNGVGLLVKTSADPRPQLRSLSQVVQSTLPGHYAFRTYAIADDLRELSAGQRFFAQFANGFASVALVLALIGIYALIAFDLNLRRQEFALRAAVGANALHQLRSASKLSLNSMVAGCVLGLLGFVWLAKHLQAGLFGELSVGLAAGTATVAVIIGASVALILAARGSLRADPIRHL
jgi:putative ABC transport system permease protein